MKYVNFFTKTHKKQLNDQKFTDNSIAFNPNDFVIYF